MGEQARPFTLRLDVARRAKLDEVAQQRHITASQLVRDLIETRLTTIGDDIATLEAAIAGLKA